MDGSKDIGLAPAVLDQLLPMHLILSAEGLLLHAGPTMAKLLNGGGLGLPLDKVLDLRRPRSLTDLITKARSSGARLVINLPSGRRRIGLKGLAVAGPDGQVIVHLSFGISVVDAIAQYRLTAADFSPTDLTVEMLYLAEAKSALFRESLRLNARLAEARAAAETQALVDPLTGLANRRAMDEGLTRMLAERCDFGLLHLDLDYFKDVNDTLGHAAGDHALMVVAGLLTETFRREDITARVGGDEFVILVRGVTDTDQLAALGDRLIAALERPIIFGGRRCRISGSIGVTTTRAYGHPDGDRMLSDADEALYASKHAGRGRVTICDAANPTILRRRGSDNASRTGTIGPA